LLHRQQEVSQLDIAKAASKILKKHSLIQQEEPKQVSVDQVDEEQTLPRHR
jgi:hypothetical protein